MYALYTIGVLLGAVALLPRELWHWWHGGTTPYPVGERFGAVAVPSPMAKAAAGCLWFHAASVGEVQALQPIIAGLQARFPALPSVVSTFTPTGKTLAQRTIPEATQVFLLPLDLPWTVSRLMRRLRPRALIVQETELWPHLFRAAQQRDVPVVIVNGRLSPRALRRYLWVQPLMRRMLAAVTLFLVQSEQIAARFQRLGVPPSRLRVVGNTNIDRLLLAAARPSTPHPLASACQGRRVLVGGSTHEGEEAILLTAYRRLQAEYPDLLLVLAPRHLERVEGIARLVQTFGYPSIRRSRWTPEQAQTRGAAKVIILDTLGELLQLYRLCTVAFVGGSLVPVGGHNILEPAVFAKPLFFGPYMHHFPELATMLCAAGGAIQVQGAEDLTAHMARILHRPQEGQAMGQRALHALMGNRGALERTVAAVATVIQHASPAGQGPLAPRIAEAHPS